MHALIQRLEKYRQEAIETRDEKRANAAFVHLNIAAALLHHIQIWLMLKSDRMEEAWDQLVEAQNSLQSAMRFDQDDDLCDWYNKLLVAEKLLFPPQQFVSSSHTFEYAECSICNEVYGECEHIAGRLYMGQVCARRVCNITAADHVALVDHPRDKGCRWTKVKHNGYMYCTLTLRQLEEADESRGHAEMCILRPG